MDRRISLLIVDDHETARSQLGRSLQRNDSIDVIGLTADSEQALCLVSQQRPDVVLLDVRRKDSRGLELCRRLAPLARLVVFTSYLAPEEQDQALQAGARDVLWKDINTSSLIARLREIATAPA